VPLSLVFGQPPEWPCRVIPLAVNVVQYPPRPDTAASISAVPSPAPSTRIPRTCASWCGAPAACRISCRQARGFHQSEIRQPFSGHHRPGSGGAHAYLASGVPARVGFGGNRTVMWLIMRGALHDNVRVLHRFYHVPASNTAVGHLLPITHESHPRGRRRVRHQASGGHVPDRGHRSGVSGRRIQRPPPRSPSSGRFRTSPPSCPRAWPRRGSKPRCWRRQRRCTRRRPSNAFGRAST